MLDKILFIFEGERSEYLLYDQLLKKYFFNKHNNILCSFKNNIYNLYLELKKDTDLEIFSLMKDRDNNLKQYNRDDFSQVYLFFDYDGHDPRACILKIKKLIHFFNEETNKGKIFISYPMLEAIKYNNVDFYDATFLVDHGKKFKQYINDHSFLQIQNLNENELKNIIEKHCKKANFIINNNTDFPNFNINQNYLFNSQYKKYIKTYKTVSILGSFPLMLLDYYGYEKIVEHLKQTVLSQIDS